MTSFTVTLACAHLIVQRTVLDDGCHTGMPEACKLALSADFAKALL